MTTSRRHLLFGIGACTTCASLTVRRSAPAAEAAAFKNAGCALIGPAHAAAGTGVLTLEKSGYEVPPDVAAIMTSTMLSLFSVFGLADADLLEIQIVAGDEPDAHVRFPGSAEQGIYFTGGMVGGILQQPALKGPALAAVLAHEVAHIYQFRHGLWNRLTSDGDVVRPAELHADFCAGWALSRVRFVQRRDLDSVVGIMTALGDSLVGFHRVHHGTPEQRAAAVKAGYAVLAATPAEVARRGEAYIASV